MKINSGTLILEFRDLLNAHTGIGLPEKLLPIVHLPKPMNLKNIIKSGKLIPQKDHNYYKEESIVFFNYGRNAYIRSSVNKKKTDGYPPTAFVFEISKLKVNIKRLLPFDSGGFPHYKIDDFKPENFEILNPSIEDVKKLIHLLCDSNEAYLNFSFSFDELVKNFGAFEALKALNNLYASIKQTTEVSVAGRTFELHFDTEIQFPPEIVIYPGSKFGDGETAMEQLNLMYPVSIKLPYDDSNTNPEVLQNEINRIIKDFIKN